MNGKRRQTRRQWLGVCAGVAGISALAGCSESDDTSENSDRAETNANGEGSLGSDWPMYGVDLQNTAYHPTAVGPTGSELTKKAVFDLNGISLSPVLVVDGVVYGHSTAGKMYAWDIDEENTLWETDKSGKPIIYDSMVYGPTDNVQIHGYDTDSGDHWKSAVIKPVSGLGRPLPTSNGILVPHSEMIWQIDPETGDYTKVIDMPSYIGGSSDWPAFHDGTLYITRSSELHAVNVETPEIEWSFETGDKGKLSKSNPVVANGSVYMASYDRQLHSITADSGEEEWTIPTDTKVEASPAVANGLVYLGERGQVMAIDTETSTIEWEAGNEITGEPHDIVIGGNVCYVTTRRGIWAYDSASGDLDWKYEVAFESDIRFSAPPTIFDGTIYIPSSDETLYGIKDV